MPIKIFALITSVVAFFGPLQVSAGQSAFRQTPASGVTITKSWLNEHQQVGEVGVCAAFVNTSNVPAARVEFLYSLIGKDGVVVHNDKYVFSVVHEAKGDFAPGVLIQGENQTTCDTMYGVSYNGGRAVTREGDGSLVVSVSQVDFADGTWWHAGPDIPGAVLSQPDASVHITKALSWEPGGSTQECASYDLGSRSVKKIHLTFSHIAEDGSDVLDDPFDVYPQLASGTVCRGWSGSLTPRVGAAPGTAQPDIQVQGKSARLVAWVKDIDFADGTSWHGSAPQPSVLAAAAVPMTVDYSRAVWWPTDLTAPITITPQAASGIEISKAYAWAFSDANECVDFTNSGTKPISHVRFLFTHLGTDHAALGEEEPLDVRGSFQTGAPKAQNCRGFNGNVVLPSLWNGGGTEGTIFINGQSSTISVRVDHVDFADGTSWQAP